MKKIMFLLVFMTAISFSVNAQTKKLTPQESAKKDATELAQLLNLSSTQVDDFYRLFEMKYTAYDTERMTAERKDEIAKIMEAKIKASLNSKQISILESDIAFFNHLKY